MITLDCILLIDDNYNDNFYHTAMIRHAVAATHIKTVPDAAKALEYIDNTSNDPLNFPFPDLILLDIHMPGMDGFDFLGKVRNKFTALGRQPMIVLMSGLLNPDNEKRAYESFAGDIKVFIQKPVTAVVMKTIVASLFQ